MREQRPGSSRLPLRIQPFGHITRDKVLAHDPQGRDGTRKMGHDRQAIQSGDRESPAIAAKRVPRNAQICREDGRSASTVG